jgi:hypothetical protein
MEQRVSVAADWSKRKRRVVKLTVFLASLLVALLIAEIGLRVVGYSYPFFYAPDARRAYSPIPNMQAWHRREGKAFVSINSRGLRDREHADEKPANTIRIAVIGDSYTEAMQVPAEEAFWAVMARQLESCAAFEGKRIETINFGVSGYGTAQELITLREHVWRYSPDIVLLAVTTSNDVTDNSRPLKKKDIPYFVRRDGQLVLDDSFASSSEFRWRASWLNQTSRKIRDSSRVIQAIHQSHGAIKDYVSAKRKSWMNSGKNKTLRELGDELGVDNLIYTEPGDDTWREAWAITEELITIMSREVETHGARFVVATLSNGIQVHPDAEARAAFLRRVGGNDIFYPDKRIARLGERENIKVVNLAPTLQTYAEQNKAFLHGFPGTLGNGHWNSLGHKLAGEILATEICNKR